MQSEDWLCNLETGMQFPDSENARRNLVIAQIPRLRRKKQFIMLSVTIPYSKKVFKMAVLCIQWVIC